MTSNLTKNQCAFCGRTEDEVAQLVAGANAFICSDCVKVCAQAVELERSGEGRDRTSYCYCCQKLKEPEQFLKIPMPTLRICKECLSTLRKLPDS